jgi:hypothetical protein
MKRTFPIDPIIPGHVVRCCPCHPLNICILILEFCNAILRSCSWHSTYRISVADGW